LKIEKISSLAKNNRFNSLEDFVINIGYDPTDIKEPKYIIRRKNIDIVPLRKQLKMPSTKDT